MKLDDEAKYMLPNALICSISMAELIISLV
jgi:hypothetical protein